MNIAIILPVLVIVLGLILFFYIRQFLNWKKITKRQKIGIISSLIGLIILALGKLGVPLFSTIVFLFTWFSGIGEFFDSGNNLWFPLILLLILFLIVFYVLGFFIGLIYEMITKK